MSEQEYRFEVAFSFAGEHIDLVREVAIFLRNIIGDGRVFFFDWFEAELAGSDADVVLQNIYRNNARVVVPCVCQRYNEKPWTQDEWRAIRDLERKSRDASSENTKRLRLLPLRFGDGEVDGTFSTAIIPDVRNRPTVEIAELILERLNLLRERTGLDPFKHSIEIRQDRSNLPPSTVGTRPPGATHNLPFFPQSFVGREEETQRLHELIHPAEPPPASGKRPWVAVKGMGGIGKTHFAVNYAWLYREVYETICWVNAAGVDITAAVAGLASEPLKLGLSEQASVTEKVAAVKQRLASGGPHLLVFDNVDHPGSFVPFVPAGAPLHVLVTTRRDDLSEIDSACELGPLSESEAMSLIRGEAEWSPEEQQAARELSERFDQLTLLLAIAGRLMKSRAWWPSKLLARVNRKGGPVPWSTSGLPTDHLFKTDPDLLKLFDASLDLLNLTDPIDAVARRVLLAGGWLARTPIPLLLFKDMAVPQNGSEPDVDLLEDAIARLVDIGLATMEELRPAVIFHRLVADYARVKGGAGPRDDALDALAEAVHRLTPNAATVPYPGLDGLTLAALQSHLLSALDLLEAQMSPARGWIPLRLAESLDAGGNASEAIQTLKRAVGIAQDKLWKARFQALLGRLLADNGHHEEARQVLGAAYPVLQSELGPCDTDCVVAGVALAESLAALARHDDALALLQPLCDKCGNLEQPTAAGSLARRTAAQLLAAQGRIEDALVQLIQAIVIEPAIPPIGYRIYEPAANTFVEMFATHALAGDSASMVRILDRVHKIFGIEPNPHVVRAQHQAGWQLMEQKRYDEALSYLEVAIAGVEKLYDPNDSDSGATHLLLGETLLHLGRSEEAVDHLERALSVAEALFEPGDWRIERAQQLIDAARSE